MKQSLLFLLLLFPILSCFHVSDSLLLQNYTSIFSFGVSLTDTGNRMIVEAPDVPRYGHFPYGMTFFGRPTGRNSDGRLVIDFIAEAFGLPLLPPSLACDQSFRHGANFAVVGATALDLAFWLENDFHILPPLKGSLSDQLGWFEELKPSLCSTRIECQKYFGRSLIFLEGFGGNDVILGFRNGRSVDEVKTYLSRIIKSVFNTVQRLINSGGINILVTGFTPMGCNGYILTVFDGRAGAWDYDGATGCIKSLNELALSYDAMLVDALARLQLAHPSARIMYADYYRAVDSLVKSPRRFGFSNGAIRACCGGGGPYNFNLSALCAEPGSSVCDDPSTYVTWDGYHSTEATHRIIASGLLNGSLVTPLNNIRVSTTHTKSTSLF